MTNTAVAYDPLPQRCNPTPTCSMPHSAARRRCTTSSRSMRRGEPIRRRTPRLHDHATYSSEAMARSCRAGRDRS